MKGFIRRQEENFVIRLLRRKYEKRDLFIPPLSELHRQASNIVDDAHRIARERGRNVMSIMKELMDDMKKGT